MQEDVSVKLTRDILKLGGPELPAPAEGDGVQGGTESVDGQEEASVLQGQQLPDPQGVEDIKGTVIQEVTAILVKSCGGEPEPIEAILSQTCETEVIFYI